MPELLSPAGNREKLEAAIRYGADAVYLAGEHFGMRAAADNFSLSEIKDAVHYAHANGKRAYITVNTMPREHEYPALRAYLEALNEIKPDALIVGDIGVFMLARELMPHTELHVSTQANTVSAATCRAWHALGAKRIVLARELTLEEIKAIRAGIPDSLELEAFIHGSMGISYSGRCLLSGFFTGRDANRGACAQPCRWNYRVKHIEVFEEKRPDEPLLLTEEDGEAFVFSSKDTCMIEHIPALMESGINSFKIEGRMKSAYYTAVVTNAYRMAMNAYTAGNYAYDPRWLRELESVSHREYASGYYFSDSKENANTCVDMGYIREKAYLATVVSYNKTTCEAECVQRNKLVQGQSAELLTPGKIGIPFRIDTMLDENRNPIASAPHPYMRFILKMPFAVAAGDIIRGGESEH
jgi:putative protease